MLPIIRTRTIDLGSSIVGVTDALSQGSTI
jgi:hypothetical protein